MSTRQIVWITIYPKRIEDLILLIVEREESKSRASSSMMGCRPEMVTRFGALKYFLNLYSGELVRGWRAGVRGLGL